jgi:glycosyltransferase involved in cell wall biosynthesis
MNIGLYFNIPHAGGGVYQYAVTLLEALKKFKKHKIVLYDIYGTVPQSFVLLPHFRYIGTRVDKIDGNRKFTNTLISQMQNILLSMFISCGLKKFAQMVYVFTKRSLTASIQNESVDIMIFPLTTIESICCPCPFITAIHDLQHIFHPQYKEVSQKGEHSVREFRYTYEMAHSYKVFAESEIGKEDIVSHYHIKASKVLVMPYVPINTIRTMSAFHSLRIRKKLHLPDIYVFYPANFWPHKNHRNLIEAIAMLKNSGKPVDLVLTGSANCARSTYEEMINLTKKYHLTKNVHFLGYVSDTDLSVIYSYAKALVMPTYFGPTNIPIVESWKMGIPVITSDIRGCKEQAKNAALFVNPDSPRDIAEKILIILKKKAIRDRLIKNGKRKIQSWTMTDFSKRLEDIFDEFKKKSQREFV